MINQTKLNQTISFTCIKFQYGGGMERYLIDLVNGIHNRGIIPKVYSAKFNTSLNEYKYINPFKINLSFVPKPIRKLLLSYVSTKYKLENEISITTAFTNADIVICGGNHKGYLNALDLKASLADLFKVKTEQKSLNTSRHIIAHSELMKKELMTLYGINKEKISVIYPPVDTNNFIIVSDEKRQELRGRLGFKKDEIIYLFPSTGHARKGFDILKKYFEKTDLPIRLVVAGTPVNESSKITSLGFCKNMPELYQATDYTIMASNYEPFGLVGIESILSGSPIVFADNIGCLEVLTRNFGYTFSRNNLNTLDESIKISCELAMQNKHRIANPFDCFTYNPGLSEHIDSLMQCIKNLAK